MVNKLLEFLRPGTKQILQFKQHQGQVVDHVPKESTEELDLVIVHVLSAVIICKESVTQRSLFIILGCMYIRH